MSNSIAIETPVALQATTVTQATLAKAPTASADFVAGQGTNPTFSNMVGDDVLLTAQGKLDSVRAIMSAISDEPADDDGLMGATADGSSFSYSPLLDAKSASELINRSNSQIPNLSGVLVPTGRSPQALLELLR